MGGTVILGAGIIGCSTAFSLSQSNTSPDSIHIIEATPTLFASASGFAGGFLARNWFGPATSQLGALSFDLHRKLADEHNGREAWGYSGSTATSLVEGKRSNSSAGHDWLGVGASRALASEGNSSGGKGPEWLSAGEGGVVEVVSGEDSTAQVDPRRLSQFLLDQCLSRGVHLHYPAKAVSVSSDASGYLSSIRITSDETETDIPCSRLIITAGAWTPGVFSSLFPLAKVKIPVGSLAGHSLVIRSPRWSTVQEANGCHAVFTTDPSGFSPEIFSRLGGEIYLAGLNSGTIPLPHLATESQIDEKVIERLRKLATRLLGTAGAGGVEDDLEVVRKGLCFRPITQSGRPIIARVSDAKLGDGVSTKGGSEGGVFVGAGHGPWGISMSLGTGQVLAGLVEGRTPSVGVRVLGL